MVLYIITTFYQHKMTSQKYQMLFLPLFVCIVLCSLIIGVIFSAKESTQENQVIDDVITADSIPSYYNDLFTPASLDLIINDSNSTFLSLTEPANLDIKLVIENINEDNCSLVYKNENDVVSSLALEKSQTISNLKKGDYAINLSCIDQEFQTLYDYVVISVN